MKHDKETCIYCQETEKVISMQLNMLQGRRKIIEEQQAEIDSLKETIEGLKYILKLGGKK